jgi:hypothetical protein
MITNVAHRMIGFTFVGCILIAVLVITNGCSDDTAQDRYLDGRGQAEADLAKGSFKVAFVDGSISSNMPEFYDYTGLLRTRYGIDSFVYSLPANPQAVFAWVRGYNEVAGPSVERHVGAQVLKETLLEAQKIHATGMTNH